MQVWPAIDICDGRCVRLRQGDFAQETRFGDPVEVAERWVAEGADRLHLVDLDGARLGSPQNLSVVARIMAAVNVCCQFGGGLRNREAVERVLAEGVTRVVVGTSAAVAEDWLRPTIEAYPHRIAVGIDARDGRVATHGWLETSDVTAVSLVRHFRAAPVAALIHTDIASDGMLHGPNWNALEAVRAATEQPLIASGGVRGSEDVGRLAGLGMDGVIVGRALYEGTLRLAAALSAARHVAEHPADKNA